MKTSKTSRFPLLFTLIGSLLVAACGCRSRPSESDGERAIHDRINEESAGRIKLVRFEKTNGAEGELMGLKIYALEFDAEIEFTETCKWVTGVFGQQLSLRTTKAPPENVGALAQFMEVSMQPGTIVRKGQRIKLSGVVQFTKKEKGWAADSAHLSSAKPIGDLLNEAEPKSGSGRLAELISAVPTATPSSPDEPDDHAPEGYVPSLSIESGSKLCLGNLKHIGLAARIWSNDHEERFPPSFIAMSNALATPKILVCPSDKSKRRVSRFSGFAERENCSYEFLTPDASEEQIRRQIVFRCPVHGHVGFGDGSVREGSAGR